MNKKIYYGDKYIEFTDGPAQNAQNQSLEVITKLGKGGTLLSEVISGFVDDTSGKSYLLVGQDFNKVITQLKKQFHYIEAAGGFIENLKKYLFIFRHNRWDLPKGKFEKNESREHCAVRECQEECGIKNLVIKKKLSSTWHLYPYKGGFALKQTYWFYMTTTFSGKLVPQLEEDITDVRWMNAQEIKSRVLSNTYYTVSDVINEALGG